MTLIERINDETKTPLSYTFIKWIQHIAYVNKQSEDTIWNMWNQYTLDCKNCDQSPVTSEFITWNKLIGERLQ